MKKSILLALLIIALTSCGGNGKRETAGCSQPTDTSATYVYYFHGKQRCKTCIAVENVTKETVETAFSNNPSVKFAEILITEKEFENLIKQYEISWNALIIAKGDDFVDITDQAFATAVKDPDRLANLIKDEVNQRLPQQ